jgi:beta-phosphoglucomutase-like phosphatase (HAD superfamily)
MKMLKAVLLDIDGTLVDSNAVHAQTWSSASAEYGYKKPDATTDQRREGTRRTFARARLTLRRSEFDERVGS